jgi:hypothetical protein
VFSAVTAVFSLGVANSSGIAGGSLTFIHAPDTISAEMVIVGIETGVFTIPRIEGDIKYEIQAVLWLADSTVVYESRQGDSIFVPVGESVDFQLDLISVLGKTSLSLNLTPQTEVTMNVSFSNAVTRAPGPAEIIFTEFYPAPAAEDSGSEGEWLEIYNRTQDTLILDGCRIAKTRTTTGSTTRHDIDSGTVLMPGEAQVYGRSYVSFRDVTYLFSMVGTKQSILFICDPGGGDVLIDSVSYTAEYVPVDSIYSQDEFVSSLKPDKIGEPSIAENWCLTKMTGDDTYGSATPGQALSDCL